MYQVEKKGELFEFKSGDSKKKFAIPRLGDLPIKEYRRLQKTVRDADPDEREEIAVDMFLDIFEKYAPGSTDELTPNTLQGLISAYSNQDGESLGE